jgi:hypothetical protein
VKSEAGRKAAKLSDHKNAGDRGQATDNPRWPGDLANLLAT